ncbi:hypothetical protein [Paraburkholderia sp. J8-2]|uniref:hypothetical protein n=1 Tax=Paraburkholderia sp. J8-2 TaxID=2805440 RepID=UPI002AB66EC6|nr:hypothetical protein [Paraburkholderia sp. J8-2]
MFETAQQDAAQRLFGAFHGMYGNQALDKFRSGENDRDGNDTGMIRTLSLWRAALANVSPAVMSRAIAKCAEKHMTFAPSLPEFLDIVKSLTPRQWERNDYLAPRLPRSAESWAASAQLARGTLADCLAAAKRAPRRLGSESSGGAA